MNFQEKGKFEYIINKSKFIGLIYELNSIDEFKLILENLKKEHKKARHICYAYYFNDGASLKIKASDDGEPQGTASKPMINAIQKYCKDNNANLVLFIIRYFGGIKLGASGLYRAYTKTTLESFKSIK